VVLDVTTHGGSGGAYARGCRCPECCAANTARTMRRRNERYAVRVWRIGADGTPYLFAPGAELAHGAESTFNNWGCRCPPCAAANSAKCSDYRDRKARVITSGSELD
jgi:hypothetical protein